ncbi:hypothetical protein ACVCCZ_000928 [Enterobacter hormaechei]|nr:MULTISPECIES: hypothetical protein [Enterobacter cloacae complex]HDR2757179.1 hypothetical protein [Enterobacter mori]EKT9344158.1 hypothetical protein [Enterobacter hormaechei]EKT9371451.1 hypothetical protein [Enterobacter hormaechei]EKW5513965.1 hypothetical protein [Enterobacter hormaechei]EMA2158619.1 hypothetical protein [Enterobacter hormaechei]
MKLKSINKRGDSYHFQFENSVWSLMISSDDIQSMIHEHVMKLEKQIHEAQIIEASKNASETKGWKLLAIGELNANV